MVQKYIANAIEQHKLPPEFALLVSTWHTPIAKDIAKKLQKSRAIEQSRTLVIGIQGTQGSGKSTMADFLRLILTHEYKLQVATLSLDDFYHTQQTRLALSQSTHPLLKTRGVPGTHDIPLAMSSLKHLTALTQGETFQLPRFNKAIDDRATKDQWPTVTGPIDIIILEGWCLGVAAQTANELATPMNTLEKDEDANGLWREHVNKQLDTDYKKLFNLIDHLAVITAPSFDVVFNWRTLQEQKLMTKLKEENTATATNTATNTHTNTATMNENQLKRFISHYERLTTHALNTLPLQGDWVIRLDHNHNITHVIYN